MPVSSGVLEGLDYRRLTGLLGEGPLTKKSTGDLRPLKSGCCLGTPLGVGP